MPLVTRVDPKQFAGDAQTPRERPSRNSRQLRDLAQIPESDSSGDD